MNLSLKTVPLNLVHQTWPAVKDFLVEAMKWSGEDYTIDQARSLLAQGTWVLLVAVDDENNIHGAGTVEFLNMPNHRVAFITAIGGKGIVNEDIHEQLCMVLKGFGATKIQCAARESAARLYEGVGFKKKHTILEVTL
jgi:hypothetical protein